MRKVIGLDLSFLRGKGESSIDLSISAPKGMSMEDAEAKTNAMSQAFPNLSFRKTITTIG